MGEIEDGDVPINPDGFTVALTIWGQFIDHDLDLVIDADEEEVPIEIPEDDPFIADQAIIPFMRSQFQKNRKG